MGSTKHGMEKIVRGIMNYRLNYQRNMVEQFKSVRIIKKKSIFSDIVSTSLLSWPSTHVIYLKGIDNGR